MIDEYSKEFLETNVDNSGGNVDNSTNNGTNNA